MYINGRACFQVVKSDATELKFISGIIQVMLPTNHCVHTRARGKFLISCLSSLSGACLQKLYFYLTMQERTIFIDVTMLTLFVSYAPCMQL